MNQKCWFIFNQDHHLGPFDADEIRSRFHRGELTMDSQLWTEGLAGWTSYRDLDQFHQTGETKELPKEEPQWKKSLIEANRQLDKIEPERVQKKLANLPIVESKPEIVLEKVIEIEIEENVDDELPPPLPPLPIEEDLAPEFLTEDVFTEEILEENENHEDSTGEFEISVLENESNQLPEEEAPHPIRWWSSVSIVALSIIVLIWFLWPKRLIAPFHELSDAQRSTLTHFAKNAPGKSWLFKLIVDKEKGKIFLAANKSDQAKLTVHLKGRQEKLLSIENSELIATLDINDNFGSASELTLNSGTNIAYGEYEVEISGRTTGWKPRLYQLLKEWPILKEMTFVKRYSAEIVYRGQLMIFNGSQKQFDEKLQEFNLAIENKKIVPLKDQLQRVQSMLAFHQAIKDLFKDYLQRISRGKSIIGFERKYNLEIGPALTSLIIDNNRLSVETMNTDKVQSKQYEVLMNQGKEFGAIAADIVTRIRKMNKIEARDKIKLNQYFMNRFDQLELDLKDFISQHENAIQSYKR